MVCVPPLEFLSSASLLLEAACSFDRALCLSRLEVHPLTFHQAQELVPFPLNGNHDDSLAEVYEMHRTGAEVAATKHEMGFAAP